MSPTSWLADAKIVSSRWEASYCMHNCRGSTVVGLGACLFSISHWANHCPSDTPFLTPSGDLKGTTGAFIKNDYCAAHNSSHLLGNPTSLYTGCSFALVTLQTCSLSILMSSARTLSTSLALSSSAWSMYYTRYAFTKSHALELADMNLSGLMAPI